MIRQQVLTVSQPVTFLPPTGGSWIPGVGQNPIYAAQYFKQQQLVLSQVLSTNA